MIKTSVFHHIIVKGDYRKEVCTGSLLNQNALFGRRLLESSMDLIRKLQEEHCSYMVDIPELKTCSPWSAGERTCRLCFVGMLAESGCFYTFGGPKKGVYRAPSKGFGVDRRRGKS